MNSTPLKQFKTWPYTTSVFEDHIEVKSLGETKIIPITNISDVRKEPLAIQATLVLNSGERVDVVVGGKVKEFMETVRELISKKTGNQPVKSNLYELEKLADLKKKGIVTQEEFDKKKAQLLA